MSARDTKEDFGPESLHVFGGLQLRPKQLLYAGDPSTDAHDVKKQDDGNHDQRPEHATSLPCPAPSPQLNGTSAPTETP